MNQYSDMIRNALELIALLWAILTFIYIRRVDRQKAEDGRVAAIETVVHKHHRLLVSRVIALETKAEHAPSQEDLNRLHGRIDEVDKVLHQLLGEFEGANRTLLLIQEHLMNK